MKELGSQEAPRTDSNEPIAADTVEQLLLTHTKKLGFANMRRALPVLLWPVRSALPDAVEREFARVLLDHHFPFEESTERQQTHLERIFRVEDPELKSFWFAFGWMAAYSLGGAWTAAHAEALARTLDAGLLAKLTHHDKDKLAVGKQSTIGIRMVPKDSKKRRSRSDRR